MVLILVLITGLTILTTLTTLFGIETYISTFRVETWQALNFAADATANFKVASNFNAAQQQAEAAFDFALQRIDKGSLVGNTLTPDSGSWLRGPVTLESVNVVPKGSQLYNGRAATQDTVEVDLTTPSWTVNWPLVGSRPVVQTTFQLYAQLPGAS